MAQLADRPVESLIEEMDSDLDKYLAEFASQSLCDGNKVRDCLLDLKLLVSKAKLCKN